MTVFSVIAVIGIVLIALLMLVKFAYVFNTGVDKNNVPIGTEVQITGFNGVFAAISGNFQSPDYGDTAVPFYLYAKTATASLCTAAMIAFFVLIFLLVFQILSLVFKKPIYLYVSTLLSLALAVILFVCFFTAIGMKNSDILPKYCSSNPNCSIKSLAILPAIVALLLTVLNGFHVFMGEKAKKLLK